MVDRRHTTLAVSIEGVGSDPAKSAGLLWVFGDAPAGAFLDGWELVPYGLAAVPEPSAEELELATAGATGSAASISLAPPRGRDDLRALFLTPPRGKVGELLSDVDDGATDISWRAPLEGAPGVVWQGLEVVRVGLNFSEGRYIGCTRGWWRTRPRFHDADEAAWSRPPDWAGRRVTLWRLRESAPAEQLDNWALAYPPGTGPNGLTIELECESILTALARAVISPVPPTPWRGAIHRTPDGDLVVRGRPAGGPGAYESQWKKRTSGHRFSVAFEAAGAIVHRSRGVHAGALPSLLFTRPSGELNDPVDAAREIALWAPGAEQRIETLWDVATVLDAHKLAPTSDCPHPHHPLTIAGAILFSDPSYPYEATARLDVLAQGADLYDWTGATGMLEWARLTRDTPELEVDHVALGLGEGDRPAVELARELLELYGFGLATRRGLLWPVQVRPATVDDAAGEQRVQLMSETQSPRTPHGSRLGRIEATVGGFHGRPTARVIIDRGLPRPLAHEGNEALSLPHVSADRAAGTVRLELAARLQWRRLGLPEQAIACQTVDAADELPALGAWARLVAHPTQETAIALDADGQAVLDYDGAMWIGLVIGRRPDPAVPGAGVLRVAYTNFRAGQYVKWRAPSMIITSVDDITIRCAPASQHGGDGAGDSENFTPGDQIEHWSRDGDLLSSEPREVTQAGPDYLELAATLEPPPAAGDVIRLARAPAYDNGGVVPGLGRVFVYIARGFDETIPGYDVKADIYG